MNLPVRFPGRVVPLALLGCSTWVFTPVLGFNTWVLTLALLGRLQRVGLPGGGGQGCGLWGSGSRAALGGAVRPVCPPHGGM